MKRNHLRTISLLLLLGVSILFPLVGMTKPVQPVTPHASPEARALLQYFHEISGHYILSGQHNYPASGDRNTRFATYFIGKTPIIWSQDFGFAARGDKDSYLSRPAIVQEAIRKHHQGAIIALCWHAVPPTADEPVTFMPQPGSDGKPLASVQGKLSEKQFRELLTPGTALYNQWVKQVDEVARYLKMLQEAHVPVLWRPYHEMNGDWFWWGGHGEGEYSTAALYRQMFDRFVNVHKLNNLIWVWSVDRPTLPSREFQLYYPGNRYLDMLALDVYGSDFNLDYYNDLLALSKGKPVVLGEVGEPPTPEIIKQQPRWAYWVVWAGMVRNTPYTAYEKLVADPHVLFLEKPAYAEGTRDFREECKLDPLHFDLSADFRGNWKLNECESSMRVGELGSTPYQLRITRQDSVLQFMAFSMVEWEGDHVDRESVTLDGKENRRKEGEVPVVQTAGWNAEKDTLTMHTLVTFTWGGHTREIVRQEKWVLQRGGRKLIIQKTTKDERNTYTSVLVYDRQ